MADNSLPSEEDGDRRGVFRISRIERIRSGDRVSLQADCNGFSLFY